ncbi:MAG: hypothetical protein AAFP17_18205 [Pseudomonadota bacterium]
MTVPIFDPFDAVAEASTVMLVGADTPYRKLLTALVEYIGFVPYAVEPGREAVGFARDGCPALILMALNDAEDPLIDTATVIRAHLRERTPPIVALVDFAHPKRRAALERHCFDMVEPKFFDIASLEDLLDGLICASDLPRH